MRPYKIQPLAFSDFADAQMAPLQKYGCQIS